MRLIDDMSTFGSTGSRHVASRSTYVCITHHGHICMYYISCKHISYFNIFHISTYFICLRSSYVVHTCMYISTTYISSTYISVVHKRISCVHLSVVNTFQTDFMSIFICSTYSYVIHIYVLDMYVLHIMGTYVCITFHEYICIRPRIRIHVHIYR